MKRKFLFLTMLVAGMSVCTPALAGEINEGGIVSSSWATSFVGESDDSKLTKGYEERLIGEHALGEFDAKGINNSEGTFTGIGYFTNGITFSFDKIVEDGSKISSRLVKNPEIGQPDLSLREITWDGDNSKWIGEGVEVYAVNYNGTGEDELVAIAYNKTAQKRLDEYNTSNNTEETLRQVEGSNVEFTYPIEGSRNVYSTDIYFPDDFKYCDSIKLVDITESLKKYGGQGQDRYDGYDLDALFGYTVSYDLHYGNETAIAIANNAENIKIGKSWQGIVIKTSVDELKENDVKFDIIAGQHYKIGEGTIFLNNDGAVDVKYDFDEYIFDILGKETAKVGIYSDLNSMMKKGKLLGNGKLTKREVITDGDAYVRIHFDANIPSYLYNLIKNK